MATHRATYSAFSEMPEALQDFLFSQEFSDADGVIQKDFGLTDEQKALVGDTVMDAIFGQISLQEAMVNLRSALVPAPVTEDRWGAFLSELLRFEVWPLRELFGEELTGVLTGGISTSGWPASRVILKPLTYGGAASEVAALAGFTLAGPQRERLRDLIISKMKGVRIDAQVKEVLVRQSDFGGLGLDAAMADKVIAAMTTLLGSVKILSEDEYADWLANETRRRSEGGAQTTVPSEDEKEIEEIKAKMPATPVVPQTILDEAIESIYGGMTDKPVDEYLAKRLRHIISSRLRDVRSELELRMLLQRDAKVGGLGMAREIAERMAGQIEAGYKTYHDRILDEEKRRLETQMEEQKKKVEERKKREAEDHAQWYREKILARKQEEEEKAKLTEQIKRTMEHPIDVKEQKAETGRFGELVLAEAPKPAAPAPPTPFGTVTVTPASVARPEVKVSKASAELAAAAATQKPRLDDVKVASPRLMGPVQELKALTLPEFRRLAKDPESAAKKIFQKIDVLGQESFERRIEGIRAWQQSGLQQAYMALVAESFKSGKPVAQLAEEKRGLGQDVPSPVELSAIISLNSTLHF